MTSLVRLAVGAAALTGALLVVGCSSDRPTLTPGVMQMKDGSTYRCTRGVDTGIVRTDCYQDDGWVRVESSAILAVKRLTMDPAPTASGRPVSR